ncbi:MAG: 30S ribosomal protein S2 [Patescibacteria group bacterium]|nr:30S ribosomal protein S2 [Patescibacteria group bacterium]
MREITLEELLEAGCHFGHQVTRSNPKARDFVFEARDNIHIIDLAKTKQGLEEAGVFVKELAQRGGNLLIVATKRQAQGIIQAQIRRVKDMFNTVGKTPNDGLFYVTNRWIGGVLTNLSEVSKNYQKLNDLKDKLVDNEERAKYTKREIGLWEKEVQRLEALYGGVAELKEKPDCLFIIDSHLEDLAVKEARNMGVTTVAIVDTNADPHIIDYPIPANDDAVGSIELITTYIMDAWIEGRKVFEAQVQKNAAKEASAKQNPKTEVKTEVKAIAQPKTGVKKDKTPEKVKKESKTKTKTAKK